MRSEFRKALNTYQYRARFDDWLGDAPEAREIWDRAQQAHFAEQAEQSGVRVEYQKDVYEIQQKKQRIMKALQEELRRIEARQGLDEHFSEAIPVRSEGGTLMARWKDQDVPLTIGMIVGDLDWDVHYALDPATVPAQVQKRYALEIARLKLWRLLQKQLVTHETRNAAIERDLRFGMLAIPTHERSEEIGFVAERMAYSLAKRLELDAHAHFVAQRANAYHDAVLKVDFLLTVPDWRRGVHVEKDSKVARPVQGVQLTIGQRKWDRKVRQIEEAKQLVAGELRDIVFVNLDMALVERAFDLWKAAGRPPGGPSLCLLPEEAEKVMNQLTKDLITPEQRADIRASIDRAQGDERQFWLWELEERDGEANRKMEAKRTEDRKKDQAIRREMRQAEYQFKLDEDRRIKAEERKRRQEQRREQERLERETRQREEARLREQDLDLRQREEFVKAIGARMGLVIRQIEQCLLENQLEQFDSDSAPLVHAQVERLQAEGKELLALRSSLGTVYPHPRTAEEYQKRWAQFEKRLRVLDSVPFVYDLVAEAYTHEQTTMREQPEAYLFHVDEDQRPEFVHLLHEYQRGSYASGKVYMEEKEALRCRVANQREGLLSFIAKGDQEGASYQATRLARTIIAFGVMDEIAKRAAKAREMKRRGEGS